VWVNCLRGALRQRPSAERKGFSERLTPDLRPGLNSAVPAGLGWEFFVCYVDRIRVSRQYLSETIQPPH
jgi:hypothetical protein